MIKKLNNSIEEIAAQIYAVFQNSYEIEAQLIGAHTFPPLLRSAKDIESSKTQFYGFIENKCLAGVIEIDLKDEHLEINSLTVDPNYFKKGIASKLINHVFEAFNFSVVKVETAIVNLPAINL